MAYKNILVIGLSIVLVGLIGFIVAHMVDWMVYTLWLVMANPVNAILLSLIALSILYFYLLLLPSKK